MLALQSGKGAEDQEGCRSSCCRVKRCLCHDRCKGSSSLRGTVDLFGLSGSESRRFLRQGERVTMTTTKNCECLNRLADIGWRVGTPGSGVRAALVAWAYNAAI